MRSGTCNWQQPLLITQDFSELAKCQHMLVYLNADTWRTGDASARFASEVEQALRAGHNLILAHEMPGVHTEVRHACE